MANQTNEPRALSAALSGPAMTTRAGTGAMHAADRHVERWAPETTANKSRPLKNLGFVDRTIAPWIETAQRSASLRLFSQYRSEGMGERQPGNVSWVFPRPWYQDELDWMAAARQAPMGSSPAQQAMLTTRGTYVPTTTQQQQPAALPSALYEYIAPSLSVAQPTTEARGIGYGGNDQAYSPLVPLAAVQAAEVMQRSIAPMIGQGYGATAKAPGTRSQPALRNVLQAMLERAAMPREDMPSRVSMQAPELVTPPAPRPEGVAPTQTFQQTEATQLAERYAEQRAQIVEVQRVARVAAEREMTSRLEAARAQVAAQTTASSTQATPAVRDATARAEAELRAQAPASGSSADSTAEVARIEAERVQTERAKSGEAARGEAIARAEQARQEAERVERARIEERIAQRLAERGGAARLHESSRAEAAAHARAETIAPVPAAPVAAERAPQHHAPAEVAAAIASLPPELQAFIGQRPEGAMRAIDELNEALRTVELMSRATASGTAFESSRGPRLMMPAGLGGLVSAIDRAHAIAEQPAAMTGQRAPMIAPLRLAQMDAAMAMGTSMPTPPAARAASSALRVPALQFLSTPSARALGGEAPTSALEAATSAKPAALSHVAWADRWLARFAGASPQSLDTLTAAGAFERSTRMQALSAAAPNSVFVSPTFDIERSGDIVRFDAAGHPVVSSPTSARAAAAPQLSVVSSSDAPAPRLIERMPEAIRYDDNAETPDDVFEAIAAGVTRARTTQVAQQNAPVLASVPAGPHIERSTAADAVAHAAPNAPGAGFAAQLASSPFAPALRHVLPLPTAPSFDVRSLFGGGLSATYLAGLLASTSDEVATSARMLPSWAAWSEQQPEMGAEGFAPLLTREAPAWDATYVAPDALDVVGTPDEATTAESAPAIRAELEAATTQLTTLRSQLLSWNVEETAAGPTFTPSTDVVGAPSTVSRASSPMTTATARTMLEAMSLPMLGDGGGNDATSEGAAWTAPGMMADRAHNWSVAQERSSADLSFDFVPPELVLAARVYGLGPAEAAQAARLALAGPGHLTAMAGTVDRTFVQAMSMEAERRDRAQLATAYPLATSTGEVVAVTRPMAPSSAMLQDASGSATPETIAATLGSHGTAFGVDRKTPRGAFLWPAGTVAALGLNAASPDGQQSMSLAALELLAAQAVAELGTFTALSDDRFIDAESTQTSSASSSSSDVITSASASRSETARREVPQAQQGSEPAETDVLASASALVPASRRGRFDALYVALSQSSSSASWSPAARAARALALAGRGEDGPVTARERAAFAWDVLPVVYADAIASFGSDKAAMAFGEQASSPSSGASDGLMASERRGRGTQDRRTIAGREYVAADDIDIDGRPGLGALSARAGEALGSYVMPQMGSSSSSSSSSLSSSSSSSSSSAPREVGPMLRAPSAAQELVRTGSGRHGGGETEIPAWFEKAARKMLEDRSAPSDGISMAELTLVTAAPASHVAASTRTAPSANPITSGANSQASPAEAGASNIDVEKIANDIYRHILVMMDVARARNGEPYL